MSIQQSAGPGAGASQVSLWEAHKTSNHRSEEAAISIEPVNDTSTKPPSISRNKGNKLNTVNGVVTLAQSPQIPKIDYKESLVADANGDDFSRDEKQQERSSCFGDSKMEDQK